MPARQAAATLARPSTRSPWSTSTRSSSLTTPRPTRRSSSPAQLPIHVVWHPHQVGYGGNQKTCYLQALQRDADVVVMLHPDGQYEPGLIPEMIEPIIAGEADLVLGSRLLIPGAALAAGMPRWKFVANRFLTTIQNRIMGTHLSEAHTGYRAYSRELLLTVPFLRNSLDFVFDSELLYQAVELRLPDRGGPGPLPLLRRGLLGRVQDRRRLRPEDPLGGGAADAPPHRPDPITQVQRLSNQVRGRAGPADDLAPVPDASGAGTAH